MLQCPKQTLAYLFYNVSSSFLLLFIFFHFTSIFLAKLFIFFGGNPFYQRNQDGYEFIEFSDEEIEDENDYYGPNNKSLEEENHNNSMANIIDQDDDIVRNSFEESSEETMYYSTPAIESSCGDEEEILARDTDSSYDDSEENTENDPTSRFGTKTTLGTNNDIHQDEPKIEINFKQDENFLVFRPTISEGKKLVQEKDDEGEIFGDTFTIGSTSKDSSEWRSSINCRDSESLRSIKACPRSISERIVHKFGTKSQNSSEFRHNPYHELESAYVAQICLTWEALNWNYKYFQRLRASRREFDPGCPAYVAQQFQQFQVLLQRYVENEPYENGRRPEIYARMRSLAPKLLQVPEYRGTRIDTFYHVVHIGYDLLFQKKKAKLKELRRSGKCRLRKRKLIYEEEIEILMAEIDLKVVSRVLRMSDLNGEQLHWCENKMGKVRVSDAKLQRDSSPLFFPAHS
ncbi:hypothetical protein DH2020_019568 [Rehmannia glutinosa]|uniref:Uncharacterized protein n=1 Tax=Rehmannia glutinosa TaxID=99300 RepID=A0ABR0WM85_REHGL